MTMKRILAIVMMLAVPAVWLEAQAKKSAAVPAKPVATARQIMDYWLIPSSEALFDVGSKEPKSDADWSAVKKQAVFLAEGGHLLMIPGRGKAGVWNNASKQLVLAGAASLKAAEEKNLDKLIEIGDQILTACEGCHKQYLPK